MDAETDEDIRIEERAGTSTTAQMTSSNYSHGRRTTGGSRKQKKKKKTEEVSRQTKTRRARANNNCHMNLLNQYKYVYFVIDGIVMIPALFFIEINFC
jgi:hypothetical protein